MTVTNRKGHPVFNSLQTLLQPDTDPSSEEADPQQTAAILSSKVTTALKILSTTPSLHALGLEVVSNALVFQCSHTDALARNSKEEDSLAGRLDLVWRFMDVAFNHCPAGWAGILFKWCVNILGRLSQSQSSPTKIEEAIQKWLSLPRKLHTHTLLTGLGDTYNVMLTGLGTHLLPDGAGGHLHADWAELLYPIHSLLSRCSKSLVSSSGNATYCMETLLSLCTSYAPNLNWLLAHIISQYPSQLISLLLDHTLSVTYPHTVTSSQPLPRSFTTLTQALEYLYLSHRDTLKAAIVTCFTKIFDKGKDKSASVSYNNIRMLLMVATHCQPMTQSVAMQCLECVTPLKIRRLLTNSAMTTPTKHDSHVTAGNEMDEDEGEILSDEDEMEQDKQNGSNEETTAMKMEEVVDLISELLKQLQGREASKALNCIMDVYLQSKVFLKSEEETVEEGEIVRESPLEAVVEGCSRIMFSYLFQLHSTCFTHLTPHGQSSSKGGAGTSMGPEIDQVMSLQSGVLEWAKQFLELFSQDTDNSICIGWLQRLISGVCVCSPELVASKVVAHLLLHCQSYSQLVRVLEIFWEINTRHPYLSRTAIKSALLVLQHQTSPSLYCKPNSTHIDELDVNCSNSVNDESTVAVCFVRSMLAILEHLDIKDTRNTAIRSLFLSALSDQILSFSRLLTTSLSQNEHHGFLLILELLSTILIGPCTTLSQPKSQIVQGHFKELSSQLRYEVIRHLLSSFFHLLKTRTKNILEGGLCDLSVELSLSKCKHLIGWCTSTSSVQSAQILAYSIMMETTLSEEMSCYFSKQKLAQARIAGHAPSPTPSLSHLLNNSHGLNSLYQPKFNSREVRHSGTLCSRQTGDRHTNHRDHVEVAVIGNSSHVLQLLLAIGVHNPKTNGSKTNGSDAHTVSLPDSSKPLGLSLDGLAVILMDLVAAQSPDDLQTWPEEDSLKYNLEWDLSIKRKFDENPILWQLLLLLSGRDVQSNPLITCASIVRSLLTVLTRHWLHCRSGKVSMFPRELESSVLLMECFAQASWLPPPLSFVSELFPFVSTQEVHLLLCGVTTFIKENYRLIQQRNYKNFKDTDYRRLVKSTILNSIEKLGPVYPRFMAYLSVGDC